jgi:hypothetical protein
MKKIFFSFLTFVLMTTVAWDAEVTVPKPSGNLNLQVGHPSTISLYDVPTQLTRERLNQQGWNVKSVEVARTDFNIQALAQGTEAYLEIVRAWPQNGGDTMILEDTQSNFSRTEARLKPGNDAKQIVNSKVLEGALKTVGKVLGRR